MVLKKDEMWTLRFCLIISHVEEQQTSVQSYKQFMLVIYDSRVIIWGIFKSDMTLES